MHIGLNKRSFMLEEIKKGQIVIYKAPEGPELRVRMDGKRFGLIVFKWQNYLARMIEL